MQRTAAEPASRFADGVGPARACDHRHRPRPAQHLLEGLDNDPSAATPIRRRSPSMALQQLPRGRRDRARHRRAVVPFGGFGDCMRCASERRRSTWLKLLSSDAIGTSRDEQQLERERWICCNRDGATSWSIDGFFRPSSSATRRRGRLRRVSRSSERSPRRFEQRVSRRRLDRANRAIGRCVRRVAACGRREPRRGSPSPAAEGAMSASAPSSRHGFDQHRSFLWGVSYRITGLAADAITMSCRRFRARLSQHRPEHLDDPRRWLMRVAVNAGRDVLRRRKRRASVCRSGCQRRLETAGDEAGLPSRADG